MPIEKSNSESYVPSTTNQSNLFINNAIVAGTLIVEHPIIEGRLQLVGFVVEDEYFNSEDFKVMGMKISYANKDSEYWARNEIIYPKLVLDAKKNHCSCYFKDSPLKWRDAGKHDKVYLVSGKYRWKEDENSGIAWYDTIYNYYLYESVLSELPECTANNVFALCRYKENGTLKYIFLNLHEIVPTIN